MSKSLLFDLKVLEFKLKESLKLYENTKIEANFELLKMKILEHMLYLLEIYLLKYLVLLKKKKLEKY